MARNKKIRSLALLFIFILSVFTLSACGKGSIASKDGNSLSLTMDEIEKDSRSGLFVLNKDNTFSPVITDLPGYAGETDKASNDRYVWFTDSKTDISSLIPTVTPSTPLVAIYDSTNEMPDKWYLEKYTNRGYTIGAHISLDEDDTMLLQGNEMLTSTSAAKVLGNIVGKDDLYEIHEISGSPVLPVDNVDNNMNILLGTEKNKLYTLKFFRGTKEEVADIYADTRIFQSSKYVELNSPFKKTSKGYFIINLPMNLDDGYYYLSDIGFFKYIGKK